MWSEGSFFLKVLPHKNHNIMKYFHYKTTDSTNTRARAYVKGGGTAPALFVADEQSGGRGRQGKGFYSPKDTGIYMSLLFDVSGEPPRSVVSLTTAAAVAVSKSIKKKAARSAA